MRLGDLDALKEIFLQDRCGDNFLPKHFVISTIDNAPTVELNDKSLEIARKSIELGRKLGKLEGKLERPKGEWIKEVFDCVSYRCSECNVSYHMTMFANFNFCPNCGAEMRKPNCVRCDHFGKCEGCEKGDEE